MPELPEVEAVRRGLDSYLPGQVVDRVDVAWPRIVVTEDLDQWRDQVQGLEFISVERRGKYLLLNLSQNWTLISHLRMEGKYFLYASPEELAASDDRKHIHVCFYLKGGQILAYHDVRKFGRMELLASDQVPTYFRDKGLGPEPSEASFDLETFWLGLQKTRRAIKTVLLDQKLVAGLGNIYVDEVLYQAQVHPETSAKSLTRQEAEAIRQAIIAILAEATRQGGSSIRTYVNALGEKGTYQEDHQVYGRQGQACPRCGTLIEKIKVGQRGTHYCPHCQVFKE